MDLEMILQKFAVFSGLTGKELQACLPYCRDAMEQLAAQRRPAAPPAESLDRAAAALAYYRWCLVQMLNESGRVLCGKNRQEWGLYIAPG